MAIVHRFKRLLVTQLLKLSGPSKWRRPIGHLLRWYAGPYYDLVKLANMVPEGFVSPLSDVKHNQLILGRNVLIDDRVTIFQSRDGGTVRIGDKVHIYRDTILQTGQGGCIELAPHLVIQPRCQFSAYKGSIEIKENAQIGPNCAFYSYNHGYEPDILVHKQPLTSKGDIVIGQDAWLGYGVIILDGVQIGRGAIIGAGSVVTKSIPAGQVAVGNPARIIGARDRKVEDTLARIAR